MSGVLPLPFLHAFTMWRGYLLFFKFAAYCINFGAYKGRRRSNAVENLEVPMPSAVGTQLPVYLLQNES